MGQGWGSLVLETTLAPKWKTDLARTSEEQKLYPFYLDYPNQSAPKVKWDSGPGLFTESVCCSESSLPAETRVAVGVQGRLEGCSMGQPQRC